MDFIERKDIESLGFRNQTNEEKGQMVDTGDGSSPDPSQSRRPFAPFLLTFLIMFVLWILLSGKFDVFHLSLGIISCALVSYFSSDLLFPHFNMSLGKLIIAWTRFALYIPWLLYQIILSNLHLLYLAFHPRMMELIDPQIIRFKTRLRSDLSQLTFANSITLTPGTITIYVSSDGYFRVHVIDVKSGESLPGEMEERIARAFGEN